MSGHPPRLYVKLTAGDSAEARLDAALGSAPIDAVLLAPGAKGAEGHLRRLVALAQGRQAAALVESNAGIAAEISADGVHLPWSETLEDDYATARRELGKDRIIGVDAGTSRHDAMTLGEMGADYIAFGPSVATGETRESQPDLIAWWSEVFEVPCVALGVTEASSAIMLATAGADFIGIELPAGLTAEQTADHVRNIADAIAHMTPTTAVQGEA